MYARISRAKVLPECRDEVVSVINDLERRMDEAPGMRHWVSVLTADDELVVLAAFEDEGTCRGAAQLNERRWGNAKHLLAEKPRVTEGEVLAFARA